MKNWLKREIKFMMTFGRPKEHLPTFIGKFIVEFLGKKYQNKVGESKHLKWLIELEGIHTNNIFSVTNSNQKVAQNVFYVVSVT